MSDSRFNEFVSIFNDRVRETRLGEPDAEGVTPLDPKEIAFTTVFIEDMEDIGLVADSDIVYFEKRLGRSSGKLNGFAVSEDGVHLVLITTITGGETNDQLKSAPAGEIAKAVKAALHVYRTARSPFHNEMEDSCPERDMISRFHSSQDDIGSLRVLVLINGLTSEQPEFEQPDDLPEVTVDVWCVFRSKFTSRFG